MGERIGSDKLSTDEQNIETNLVKSAPRDLGELIKPQESHSTQHKHLPPRVEAFFHELLGCGGSIVPSKTKPEY